MPWKESTKMSERMNFVLRLEAGERMSDLCREYGIARKTGYKFVERYKSCGPSGLEDRSHRPERFANCTPQATQDLILEIKNKFKTWGAAKIGQYMRRKHSGITVPARSTIHEILFKNGLVKKRRARPRNTFLVPMPFIESKKPNEVWCSDYKGQFRLQKGGYCYPLTISDHFSRYLFECEGLENTKGEEAFSIFERAFLENGLPDGMLTDNGPPFGTRGLFRLSRLSIWWLRLGIKLYRIEPGHPEQNGRHERMHLTLAQDTTRPARENILQQQETFDDFKRIFNIERPHEALEMKVPAEVYKLSERPYPKELPEPTYPLHDTICCVRETGHVRIKSKREFFLSEVFGGQTVGLRQEEDKVWRVSFLNYELGYYDEKDNTFYPDDNLILN